MFWKIKTLPTVPLCAWRVLLNKVAIRDNQNNKRNTND